MMLGITLKDIELSWERERVKLRELTLVAETTDYLLVSVVDFPLLYDAHRLVDMYISRNSYFIGSLNRSSTGNIFQSRSEHMLPFFGFKVFLHANVVWA